MDPGQGLVETPAATVQLHRGGPAAREEDYLRSGVESSVSGSARPPCKALCAYLVNYSSFWSCFSVLLRIMYDYSPFSLSMAGRREAWE